MNTHDLASIAPDGQQWVARCACGTLLKRPSRGQAVAAHEHHWGLAMSRQALDRKETFGHLASTHPTNPRLQCLDCDQRCATVPELARHTQETHGRQPTSTERTPIS